MASYPITDFIAILPTPTNLSFSFAKDWGPEASNAFSGDGIVEGLENAAGQVVGAGMGNSMSAGVGAANGIALNKNEKALFRTLPFRTISFSWNLVPKSAGEAELYEAMIHYLKIVTAPGDPEGKAVWKYPDTFSLEIKSKVGGFIAFKTPEMACTDLVVNYTPQGFWTSHNDGQPVVTGLQMSFMERELAVKEKIQAKVII